MRILHFADAHIDMANYGRHDAQTGLPLRVVDFLNSLDEIIDTAIAEQVDLVLFAGDAYKDRNPAPTFQREWGRRIMKLSRAGIPTLLLVGNHDLSPALGRAHALDAFDTLEVPRVQVIDRPKLLGPQDLYDLPLQIIALPWVSRSALMASMEVQGLESDQIYDRVTEKLIELVQSWTEETDPSLPVILTAHCSVQGAVWGGERMVMLGGDLVLPGSLVKNPRYSYVALGHIHKSQDLNLGQQPPVIYPGSIERIDFGEARDDKFFVIATVEKGQPTQVEWRKLSRTRPFIDRRLTLEAPENVNDCLRNVLPEAEALQGAILRLVLEYPREWEALIDEAVLREWTATCFEFHLIKRPQVETRIRIPEDQSVGSMTPLQLLDKYWRSMHAAEEDVEALHTLADQLIQEVRSLGQ